MYKIHDLNQLDSLQILVSLIARLDLISYLLDAVNTFIRLDLSKSNLIKILEKLQDFNLNIKEDVILKLIKFLYKLYQSANL